MRTKLIDVIDTACALGESILWDARTNLIWLTDILGGRMISYDSVRKRLRDYPTPEPLCAFGLTDRPGVFVSAFSTGFALFQPETGKVEWIARPDEVQDGRLRLNDGRVDNQGRFWCGSMVLAPEQGPDAKGSLYSLSSSGHVSIHENGVGISNGLCWSPSSDRMYFADSSCGTIFSYRFDAPSGCISDKALFATTAENSAPDGAIVDSDGCVWSAQWGRSRVIRYAPTGEVDYSFDAPTSQPTCPTFGGPYLFHLFVSSARVGLEGKVNEDRAGSVFVYETEVSGFPNPQFNISRN